MTAPETVWEKKDVSEVDENGVLLLYGRYLQEKNNRKNSQVLVVALEKKPDAKEALKSARTYFEDKKKEEDKNYMFDSTGTGTLQAGSWKITYEEIKVQLGSQATRYYLVAAVQSQANTLAILCDSTWESRQIWRQDFFDLLKTLQIRKQ